MPQIACFYGKNCFKSPRLCAVCNCFVQYCTFPVFDKIPTLLCRFLPKCQQWHKNGIPTCMGAPNVVRGQSQSGYVSARDRISENACDFLCSDYHPSSMLQAPYTIHHELGLDLNKCFEMVSTIPSKLARLDDRGEIIAGKIADLVVIDDCTIPKVVLT